MIETKGRPFGRTMTVLLELCNCESGKSLPELCAESGLKATTLRTQIPQLVQKGRIFQAGERMRYRFFAEKEQAAAYQLLVPEIEAKRRDELRSRKRIKDAARERARRAKRRAAKGLTPYDPNDPSTFNPGVTGKPRKRNQGTPVLRSSRPPKEELPPPEIIWPDHVQVQRAPTPKDERFTFTPPPGWRGQITRDWLDRRLQNV